MFKTTIIYKYFTLYHEAYNKMKEKISKTNQSSIEYFHSTFTGILYTQEHFKYSKMNLYYKYYMILADIHNV